MTRALGIDVSKWDGIMDFHAAAEAGASFVIIKASQNIPDPFFLTNWKNSKGILLRGAFHYLDWSWSEIEQAKLFVNLMGTDFGELPPCLDLENPPPKGMTAALVSGKAWNFLTYVQKATGIVPMIYVGYYYWNSWGSNNIGWSAFPLWLPWYAPEIIVRPPRPWGRWTFWQYTSHGDGLKYGAESKSIDLSYFNGTTDDLKLFASHITLKCPTCGAPMPAGWSYNP